MRRDLILFAVVLIFGASLRLVGLTRGYSASALPDQSGLEVFYTFHPDEETLLRAALELDSLLAPPLTAYGTFPMLVARAALEVCDLFYSGELALDEAAARPAIFVLARLLSIAFSLGLVALVFWIGRAHFGLWAGVLAAFLLASAPLAIQQAHFYTVDGVFAFLVFAALAASLRALRTEQMRWFVATGLLIGLAAATRLNGALFGVALAVVYMGKGGMGDSRTILLRCRRPELWATALVALGVLFSLEPYLVTDSALMRRALDSDDFAYSLQIASGEVLRPWTLVDVHTTPYLHFWTHLWPQSVGWPLTGLLVGGVLYALWRRGWPQTLLLLWCVLYFLSVGGLHTKHVRYLLPMLPALALLGAAFCGESWRWLSEQKNLSWLRWSGALVVGGVLCYTAAYGAAFARIYAVEDARLQAVRWLYSNVLSGSSIAVENGGFSLSGFVDSGTYEKSYINSGRLFGTRGYLLCEAGRQYLYSRVRDADYIAVVDVNRHVQYTAVPEMYPVLAGFYDKLLAGELGFKPVQHVKVYPEWGRWRFADEEAEPSFYSFDHPGVWILQRTADFADAWQRWERELATDAHCVDVSLKDLVSSIKRAVSTESAAAVTALRQRYPDFRLSALLEADIRRQLGDEQGITHALSDYSRGYVDPALSAQFIPWASATSLLMLDLPELALSALADGVDKRAYMRPDQRVQLADSYASIASRLARGGQGALATEIYRLAALVDARAEFCNELAALALQDGRAQEALSWWQTSLELDSTQMPIYRLAGKTAYRLGDYGPAFDYLGKAVELDPLLEADKKVADFNALAQEAQRMGMLARAIWLWQRSLALDSGQEGVRVLLRAAQEE